MTRTTWEPDLVSPALLALTNLLGEPGRDLAVLAEGNTSELLDDGRLVVKASGAGLRDATAEDFVVTGLDEVMAVVDDPATTQADLSAVLVAAGTERAGGAGPRRGSIETVVHAAVHTVARDAGTYEGEGVIASLGPNVTTYRIALDNCDPPTIYWLSVMAKKDGGSSTPAGEVSTADLGSPP